MTTFNYRTSLIAGSVLTLAISGLIHAQQPANIEPVLRELGIMRNIFAGALEQQTRTNKFFGNGTAPDALYLAGQGMVFTFNMPGVDGFMYDFSEFCNGNCDNGNFNFNFNDDFDVDLDIDVPPIPNPGPNPGTSGNFAAVQEELRATGEVLREKSEELRDLQRELRDLGREQRNNPDDEDLDTQMATLESSVDELEQELKQQSESYRQTIEEIQDKRATAVNERREQQIDEVLGVLCDYGSTLKALPADENVSLVFRNFTGNTHQVYVISHAAVSGCTSADSMQASAVSYQL